MSARFSVERQTKGRKSRKCPPGSARSGRQNRDLVSNVCHAPKRRIAKKAESRREESSYDKSSYDRAVFQDPAHAGR
ncbi:MAG TPA: hypothetical protein DCR16_06985 [Lachnospiraceae bacterium]|nr:hypothetical protein [Lachnospiraceae bacterium]